jgi:FkbM family methyltransferase
MRLSLAVSHGDREAIAYMCHEVAGERTYDSDGVRVRSGDTVVDVGANIGVAAVYFDELCGAGRVHSFEPVPSTFAVLARNIADRPSCTAHPFGIADAEGELVMTHYVDAPVLSTLYADDASDGDLLTRVGINLGLQADEARGGAERRLARREAVTCRFRRLSDVLREEEIDRVDLLKIDVEGAECQVLAGIDDEHWPLVRQAVLEVHRTDDVPVLRSTLERHGLHVNVTQDSAFAGTRVSTIRAWRR